MGMEPLSVPNARQTLAEWIDTYSQSILRVSYLYLADRTQAEDVLQETWISVWKQLQRGNLHLENEKAWILKIAVNKCRDLSRTSWFRLVDRNHPLDDLPESLCGTEEPDISLSLLVHGLPQKLREIVLLYHYQGLTMQETAMALGISVSTVNRRLKKANALLKAAWMGGEDQ